MFIVATRTSFLFSFATINISPLRGEDLFFVANYKHFTPPG